MISAPVIYIQLDYFMFCLVELLSVKVAWIKDSNFLPIFWHNSIEIHKLKIADTSLIILSHQNALPKSKHNVSLRLVEKYNCCIKVTNAVLPAWDHRKLWYIAGILLVVIKADNWVLNQQETKNPQPKVTATAADDPMGFITTKEDNITSYPLCKPSWPAEQNVDISWTVWNRL